MGEHQKQHWSFFVLIGLLSIVLVVPQMLTCRDGTRRGKPNPTPLSTKQPTEIVKKVMPPPWITIHPRNKFDEYDTRFSMRWEWYIQIHDGICDLTSVTAGPLVKNGGTGREVWVACAGGMELPIRMGPNNDVAVMTSGKVGPNTFVRIGLRSKDGSGKATFQINEQGVAGELSWQAD